MNNERKKLIWRRMIGGLMVLVGLVGVGLSLVGIRVGRQVIGELGVQIDGSLTAVSGHMDTVLETLLLADQTVTEMTDALDATEAAVLDASLAIDQSLPMLDQVTTIVSSDAPASLESVQATIPDVVQVAQIIDETLTTLTRFRIDETIPIINFRIHYDLGINYNPAKPFDKSVQEIGDSMADLPDKMRSLEGYVSVTQDNMEKVGEDLLSISTELDDVSSQVVALRPQLREYIQIVSSSKDKTSQFNAHITDRLMGVQKGMTIALIWLALAQIVPLYLGWDLVMSRKEKNEV